MTGDPQFSNMPLVVAFLKSFGRVYLGPLSQSEKDVTVTTSLEEPLPEGVTELVTIAQQQKFREMFVSYFETASKTLVKGQLVSLAVPKCLLILPSACWNKTNGTTRPTSNLAKSSKIVNKRTRK